MSIQKIDKANKITASIAMLGMSDVRNFKTVQDHIYDSYAKPKTKEEFDIEIQNNHLLYADNREKLKTLFGKPTFYYKGEFYNHCHAFKFEGYLFIVSTAKDKGTSYEAESSIPPHHEHIIIDFMNEFTRLLQVGS